jgi:hypothetical protein
MSNLMLHAGAIKSTREYLATLPTPAPIGSRHFPTPHSEFVDLVTRSVKDHGYEIQAEQFGVTPNGDRFFGLMEIARHVEGEYIPKSKGYALNIGLRASHDQTFPKALSFGSRVFVCDNLAFSGEVKVSTRQTINVNRRLPSLVESAMQRVVDLDSNQQERFQLYQDSELNALQGDAALLALYRRHVLGPRTLDKALQEWDTPSHEEHLNDGCRTVWTLQNAVTEALKSVVLSALPQKTVPMTHFLDELVGFRPI